MTYYDHAVMQALQLGRWQDPGKAAQQQRVLQRRKRRWKSFPKLLRLLEMVPGPRGITTKPIAGRAL